MSELIKISEDEYLCYLFTTGTNAIRIRKNDIGKWNFFQLNGRSKGDYDSVEQCARAVRDQMLA